MNNDNNNDNGNKVYQMMQDAGYFQHAFNIINSPDTYNVFFDQEDDIIFVAQGNGNCPTFWEFDLERYNRGQEAKDLPGFKTSEQRWLYYQRLLRIKKEKRRKSCTTK